MHGCQNSASASIRILAFGEVLWDMLPAGKKLGGAPVNFLYHAQTLGAETRALTSVGDDELGREIVDCLNSLNVPLDALQISQQKPTGTVAVTLDSKGNPSYKIVEDVAWDYVAVDEKVSEDSLRFLTDPTALSAFYFGSLALRTEYNRQGLLKLLDVLPSDVVRICDLNLRAPFYSRELVDFTLGVADVFKLNDSEAVLLDQMFNDVVPGSLSSLAGKDGSLGEALCSQDQSAVHATIQQWAKNWLDKFNLKTIILTCGAHGAFLFKDETMSYAPSIPVDVKDAVGAGDSFAAVCVVGLLRGIAPDLIVTAAAKRAAFVCSQNGAAPNVPDELRDPFNL